MTGPKLLSLIALRYPFMNREAPPGTQEMIAQLGFDTDGQAWGLVTRYTDLGPSGMPDFGPERHRPTRLGRVDFVRWVRCDAIPFDERETVSPADGWLRSETPKEHP